jgi:ribosomal protein L29
VNKEKNNLRELDSVNLVKKIAEYKAELFSLRLKAASEYVKDNSQFKQLRKNIARALTYLRQKMNNEA